MRGDRAQLRQEHAELGAVAGAFHLALDLDLAVHGLHDAVDHGQSESAALAGRLGGEERIVDPLHHVGRHDGTGIGHCDADSSRGGIDANADGAVIVHRVGGVDAEVHHDLHDLRAVGQNLGCACR